MSAAISMQTQRNRGTLSSTGLMTVLGAVAGLLIGIIVTGTIIIWGMTEIADGPRDVLSVPLIIEFHRGANGDVTAHSGNGIVVPAFAGLVIGAASGYLIGWARRRR